MSDQPILMSSATLNALNAAVTIDVANYLSVGFVLAAGTLQATITYQVSYDYGSTFTPYYIRFLGDNGAFFSEAITNPNAQMFFDLFVPAGVTTVRIIVTNYTSGSAVGTLQTTNNPITPLWSYGRDLNSVARILNSDTAGNLLTSELAASSAGTATGTAGSAVTLTLAGVASSFHYITSLEIMAYNTAARTGGTTPVLVTSTNLPGSPVWTFGSAGAVGTTEPKIFAYPKPYKSSAANTNTTIVCPATTSVIWRVNCTYLVAS